MSKMCKNCEDRYPGCQGACEIGIRDRAVSAARRAARYLLRDGRRGLPQEKQKLILE